MRFEPHQYQQFALSWLIQRSILDGEPGSALFLDPGLGKTSITLAWVKLMKDLSIARKTLVVAPLRVVYSVWPRECQKWDQFNSLRCSIVHGTATQRMKALKADADIYLINPENMPWLYAQEPVFNTLVVDESSKFKNWSAKRTRALRKMLPGFERRLILTGTPSPNSIADLFSQIYLLDEGKALGTAITRFRNRWFYRGGYGGYQWMLVKGADVAIQRLIDPLCLRLSAADHLDLPEMLVNDIWVDLPEGVMADYKRLEREMFIALNEETTYAPVNSGTKYLACKQLAGGGLYGEDREPIHFHGAKTDVLVDLVDELQGKPVLVAFQYRHDLDRIRKLYPSAPSIDGSSRKSEASELIDKWNEGGLPMLCVQPQALSHGVNMQSGPGRDIIWFGLTDNLEAYLQLNARIHRQGVTGQVRIHRILANRTVDEAVVNRIESKDSSQTALLDSLKRYKDRTNESSHRVIVSAGGNS